MHPSSMAEGASTASLDRIDSSKGYVRGNIQWVHIAINFMKHSLPEEEFIRWCCLVAQYRGKSSVVHGADFGRGQKPWEY